MFSPNSIFQQNYDTFHRVIDALDRWLTLHLIVEVFRNRISWFLASDFKLISEKFVESTVFILKFDPNYWLLIIGDQCLLKIEIESKIIGIIVKLDAQLSILNALIFFIRFFHLRNDWEDFICFKDLLRYIELLIQNISLKIGHQIHAVTFIVIEYRLEFKLVG